MLDRIVRGDIPAKPHTFFRSAAGELRYEECLTRGGFEGPFSMLYHQHRPHEGRAVDAPYRFRTPDGGGRGSLAPAMARHPLRRRHYRCLQLTTDDGGGGGPPIASRVPLLFNAQVVIGFCQPSVEDPVYFANSDADDLYFILRGAGLLRSLFGDLRYQQGDYLCVPKGTVHRLVPDAGVPQGWMSMECKGGLALPSHYRNAVGQLRMDAPYSHRDFRRPQLAGPVDEGLRTVVVKRGDEFFGFEFAHAPLDVVGWDGTVYPFAFPILAFQPRVGQIHLPPPAHATFEAGGALICSFVPRPLDFHPQANPCPYPHASVDIDEVLFYANDAFGSRHGVGEGSISLHPAGIPHGPHPGAYETPPGKTHTDEIAVMLDCAAPLRPTTLASAVEDRDYHDSFIG
ncbi:MAG: homogentisate 1,2-dioxygenase [Myxococcales bacterium]